MVRRVVCVCVCVMVSGRDAVADVAVRDVCVLERGEREGEKGVRGCVGVCVGDTVQKVVSMCQ